MQLYKACSPVVKELVKKVSGDVGGVPPRIEEMRLDESGVDGESVVMA
jgi:hypothetical protein